MLGVAVPAEPDEEGDGEPGAWLSVAPLGATGGGVEGVCSPGAVVEPGELAAGAVATGALATGTLLASGLLASGLLARGLPVVAGASLGLATGPDVDPTPRVVAGAPLPAAGDRVVSPCVPLAAAADVGAADGGAVAPDCPHAPTTRMEKMAAAANFPRRAVATRRV